MNTNVKEHDAAFTIRRDFERVPAALVATAQALPTATLHEAGGKIGALPSAIKPVAASFRCCGSALTVHSPGGDNLWRIPEHAKVVADHDAKGGDATKVVCEANARLRRHAECLLVLARVRSTAPPRETPIMRPATPELRE